MQWYTCTPFGITWFRGETNFMLSSSGESSAVLFVGKCELLEFTCGIRYTFGVASSFHSNGCMYMYMYLCVIYGCIYPNYRMILLRFNRYLCTNICVDEWDDAHYLLTRTVRGRVHTNSCFFCVHINFFFYPSISLAICLGWHCANRPNMNSQENCSRLPPTIHPYYIVHAHAHAIRWQMRATLASRALHLQCEEEQRAQSWLYASCNAIAMNSTALSEVCDKQKAIADIYFQLSAHSEYMLYWKAISQHAICWFNQRL